MEHKRLRLVFIVLLTITVVSLIIISKLQLCSSYRKKPTLVRKTAKANILIPSYDKYVPLIFIGGVPRSGTTLMRAMLDAHPDVRCGQETRVIPRILEMRKEWLTYDTEVYRLEQAGVNQEVLNAAISSLLLEIIVNHGEPAPRLCDKDPFTLIDADYLLELFPKAKFVFMVRDGRATVHSMISRQVRTVGFDLSSYRQCMQQWNNVIAAMYKKCLMVGSSHCMVVYYEQLVLHPAHWMREILYFLDVPWNDTVLHHEDQINKPGGVRISKVERSSDQVIKPVNLEALTSWVGQIPQDVIADMGKVAPMLAKLGYDPNANPPYYGFPDNFVVANTRRIRHQTLLWRNRTNSLNLINIDSM